MSDSNDPLKEFNESKYKDILDKILKYETEVHFRRDLDQYTNKQLIELKDRCARRAVCYEYAEFLIHCELKNRLSSMKESLEQAKYDRENSELPPNESTLSVH
jgi:hypothetical protein